MQCPTNQALKDFVTGAASNEAADAVAEHVSDCARCEATVAQLEHESDTILSVLHAAVCAERSPSADCLEAVEQLKKTIGKAAADATVEFQRVQDSNAAAQLKPGMQLGPYRILEKLGQGGMGAVYKAMHPRLNRIVAIKLIAGHSRNEQSVARFNREMQAVAALDHPAIVRAFDAGEHQGLDYFVMEFVAGLDLSRIAAGRRISIGDACEVIRQAALGLSHLHSQGLVHRDIKPSNLMLCASGQVKLLDLGLARLIERSADNHSLTATDQPLGTTDYIAPEQAISVREIDARADLYSLGATLFRLLAGRAPFDDEQHTSALAKLIAHVHEERPKLIASRSDAPPALSELIEKLMARTPGDRPQAAAEVALSLTPFASGADLASLLLKAQGPKDDGIGLTELAASLDTPVDHACDAETSRGIRLAVPQPEPVKRNRRRPAIIALGILAIAGLIMAVVYSMRGNIAELPNSPPSAQEIAIANSVTSSDGSSALPPPASSTPQSELEQRRDLGPLSKLPITPATDPRLEPLTGLLARPGKLPGIGRWQIETQRPRHGLDTNIAWHPTKPLLACCMKEWRTVRIYDTQTLALVAMIEATKPVNKCEWSPDGERILVSASYEPESYLFDAEFKLIARVQECGADFRWSPDSQLIANCWGNGIKIHTRDGKPGATFPDLDSRCTTLAWRPDGILATGEFNGSIRLWSSDGTRAGELNAEEEVTSIDWSGSGQLASLYRNGKIRVWNADHQLQGTLEVKLDWSGKGSLRWQPNGDVLAFGGLGNSIQVIDSQAHLLRKIETGHWYYCFSWRPDGTVIGIGNGNGALLLKGLDGSLLSSLDNCDICAEQLAWSPHGRALAVGMYSYESGGPAAKLFSSNGVCTSTSRMIGHASSISWSPDSNKLAIASWSPRMTTHLLGSDLAHVRDLKVSDRCVAFSPDGQFLATGGWDKLVRIWDAGSDRPKIELAGHTLEIRSIDWSLDGLLVSRDEKQTRIWKGDGALLGVINLQTNAGHGTTVVWSRSGKSLALDSGGVVICYNEQGEKYRVFNCFDLIKDPHPWSIAYSPHDDRLAVGCSETYLSIWDIRGTLLRTLPTGSFGSWGVSWSAANNKLAAASHFGRTLSVWNGDTYQPEWTAVFLPDGQSISFSADGQLLDGDAALVEKELVYLVEKPEGLIEVIKPSQFVSRFGDSSMP